MSSDNKYLFPNINNIKDLQIDEVGKYSISKPDDANVITRLIKKELYNNKITKNIITRIIFYVIIANFDFFSIISCI